MHQNVIFTTKIQKKWGGAGRLPDPFPVGRGHPSHISPLKCPTIIRSWLRHCRKHGRGIYRSLRLLPFKGEKIMKRKQQDISPLRKKGVWHILLCNRYTFARKFLAYTNRPAGRAHIGIWLWRVKRLN